MKKLFLFSLAASLVSLSMISCDDDSDGDKNKKEVKCSFEEQEYALDAFACKDNNLYKCGDKGEMAKVEECGANTCKADKGMCEQVVTCTLGEQTLAVDAFGCKDNDVYQCGADGQATLIDECDDVDHECKINEETGAGTCELLVHEDECDDTYVESCDGTFRKFCGQTEIYGRLTRVIVDSQTYPNLAQNCNDYLGQVCASKNGKAVCVHPNNSCTPDPNANEYYCEADSMNDDFQTYTVSECVEYDGGAGYKTESAIFCAAPCVTDDSACDPAPSCDTEGATECGDETYLKVCSKTSESDDSLIWKVFVCDHQSNGEVCIDAVTDGDPAHCGLAGGI